jgi:hypothetical protein
MFNTWGIRTQALFKPPVTEGFLKNIVMHRIWLVRRIRDEISKEKIKKMIKKTTLV